eukprot:1650899-Rhodomonas_salina.2
MPAWLLLGIAQSQPNGAQKSFKSVESHTLRVVQRCGKVTWFEMRIVQCHSEARDVWIEGFDTD